jgi:hypothetical protein
MKKIFEAEIKIRIVGDDTYSDEDAVKSELSSLLSDHEVVEVTVEEIGNECERCGRQVYGDSVNITEDEEVCEDCAIESVACDTSAEHCYYCGETRVVVEVTTEIDTFRICSFCHKVV